MDRLKHLKPLSQINSSKSVQFLTPVAHPGSHCPMHSAISIAAGIKGLSTIVIGTRECGFYSRNVPRVAGNDSGLHWVYVLDSNEVVFGCKSGLIEAIKEISSAGAKAVALISTCVPEVIGEDLDGIIKEAEAVTEAKLFAVKVPQFNSNGSTTGGLIFYESLGTLMKKRDKKPRTVNLLGYDPAVFRRSNPPKLLSLLHERGLDLRYYYASEATFDDYMNAPEAALNLVFSMHNIQLARRMEELFDIPYIIFQDTYGIADLDSAFHLIEDTFNISLMENFAEERGQIRELESSVRAKLKGKNFIMTFPYVDSLPLAAYLCDLGLRPLLVHIEDYCPHNAHFAERMVDSGNDPYICHMVNDKADAELLNTLEFDICIGRFKHNAGQPCLKDMSGLGLAYDYSRTTRLLNMLNGLEV